MSRRKAREVAFKVMFQVDQIDADPKQAFDYLLEETSLAEKDKNFAWDLINGCVSHLHDIDNRINKYSSYWPIDRISAVDRSIMRIAGYEIMFIMPSQAVIAIDEAIEIAKRYGDENASSFINAVLDKILGEKA